MEITVSFAGGKKVDAGVEKHVIRTDQPVDEGGEGTAPEPLTYCLASMGTCAGSYVQAYLKSRNLPWEEVKIIQTHERDPRTGRITKVVQSILLPPEIPEKHHQPIIRSAALCAVKKLFDDPPVFDIQTEISG